MPRTITTSCPNCGLSLIISPNGAERSFEYDLQQWKKLCNREDLGSPALCLWQARPVVRSEVGRLSYSGLDS